MSRKFGSKYANIFGISSVVSANTHYFTALTGAMLIGVAFPTIGLAAENGDLYLLSSSLAFFGLAMGYVTSN
jgi:hypothetical protein